jgi:hypothetical protein
VAGQQRVYAVDRTGGIVWTLVGGANQLQRIKWGQAELSFLGRVAGLCV